MGGRNRFEKACSELSQAELGLVNACRRVQRLLPPARSLSNTQDGEEQPGSGSTSEAQTSEAEPGSLGAIRY